MNHDATHEHDPSDGSVSSSLEHTDVDGSRTVVEFHFAPLNVEAFEHGEHDACTEALQRVHAFLNNELPATEADLIRAHLDACEKCFDDFDVEATITRLLQRSCQSPCAPESLKVRILGLRVEHQD